MEGKQGRGEDAVNLRLQWKGENRPGGYHKAEQRES